MNPIVTALWACRRCPGPLFDTAQARLAWMLEQHGSTRALASALGVTTRTIQRLEVALEVRERDERKVNRQRREVA